MDRSEIGEDWGATAKKTPRGRREGLKENREGEREWKRALEEEKGEGPHNNKGKKSESASPFACKALVRRCTHAHTRGLFFFLVTCRLAQTNYTCCHAAQEG